MPGSAWLGNQWTVCLFQPFRTTIYASFGGDILADVAIDNLRTFFQQSLLGATPNLLQHQCVVFYQQPERFAFLAACVPE